MSHILILTTTHDKNSAELIANALINENLAACVSIKEIFSIYKWDGAMEKANEFELSIKTRKDLFDKVKARILELHSYELPQIIALDIKEGFDRYLQWIDNSTKGQK